MKLPKKYLKTNPKVMKREIMKHKDKSDNDSSAYGPWDADYKSRKAGKGKKVETKPSKYTKKFKEMFGESEQIENDEPILTYEEMKSIQNSFEEILLEEDFSEEENICRRQERV